MGLNPGKWLQFLATHDILLEQKIGAGLKVLEARQGRTGIEPVDALRY